MGCNDKYNGLTLHVISHTHWDREWYQTFEGFRKRLVLMVDELIDTLESNEDYRYFTFDGQTIVMDDYLAIRPENGPRLRRLVESRRLILGPWYVMPDEFLVSGESLVRNLKYGRELTRAYGGRPMDCGYVVDIFGHNSQFPQILKGFGIGSAMLFRGIGDYEKDMFRWEARDGSGVLCAKLDPDRCYSNFFFALRWPFDGIGYDADGIARRMRELLDYALPRAAGPHLVMMDGVDHLEIEPRLPWLLQTLRERFPGMEIIHSTVEEYFEARRKSSPELETLRGELYHCGNRGLNNAVLKNVLSSTVHLKQLNDLCELRLTRWAEPFAAAAGGIARGDMGGLIRHGWKTLMQNHPHDSICGCSISRVHEDNLYRFNQVMDVSGEVIGHSLGAIAAAIDTASAGADHAIVLFNPMQMEFKEIAEAVVELPEDYPDNFELVDGAGNAVPYQMIDAVPATYKGVFKFRRLPDFQRINRVTLAFAAAIPPVGYAAWRIVGKPVRFPGKGEYTYSEYNAAVRYPGSMRTGMQAWENEHLQVRFEAGGSLSVLHKQSGKTYERLVTFEDCGDLGEGYNFKKPIHDLALYGSGGAFAVEVDGPALARWRVRTEMNVPAGLASGENARSENTVKLALDTTITMRAGCSRLEFHTEVENSAVGHRIRVLFPTHMRTDSYLASTPFAVERRDIRFPDTSSFQEQETFVMPNQGLVALQDDAGTLAVYNKGLYEAQVTEDESRTVALTLFRSVTHEVGRDEAGVAAMRMKLAFDYALDFLPGGCTAAEALLRAEAWRAGIRAVTTPASAGRLAPSHSWLSVRSQSAVMTSFRQSDSHPDMLVARLFNASDGEDAAELAFGREIREAWLLDLDDDVVSPLAHDGTHLRLTAKKWEILTVGVVVGDTVLY